MEEVLVLLEGELGVGRGVPDQPHEVRHRHRRPHPWEGGGRDGVMGPRVTRRGAWGPIRCR